jgi:hypothetical protein
MYFPKDKNFPSENIWDTRIDRSLMLLDLESTEDMERFWENLSHKMFKPSGPCEGCYRLHESREDSAQILDAKQELVPEYVRYSVSH